MENGGFLEETFCQRVTDEEELSSAAAFSTRGATSRMERVRPERDDLWARCHVMED